MLGAVFGGELGDEVGGAVRQCAFAGRQQAVAGVGEAGVPAGEVTWGGVVELVVHVPAEHAVAEPTAASEQSGELLQADELAAQHAVDVREAQQHLPHAALRVGFELRRKGFRHGLFLLERGQRTA